MCMGQAELGAKVVTASRYPGHEEQLIVGQRCSGAAPLGRGDLPRFAQELRLGDQMTLAAYLKGEVKLFLFGPRSPRRAAPGEQGTSDCQASIHCCLSRSTAPGIPSNRRAKPSP